MSWPRSGARFAKAASPSTPSAGGRPSTASCDGSRRRAERPRPALVCWSGWVSRGRVVLVGAGPGDPDLITVKGLRWLRGADVVVYDQLVGAVLLEEAPAGALRIFAGKSAGRHYLEQSAINSILIHHAEAGRLVVRLKGGDPFVFGRGGEEVLTCARAGVAVEVVPGVSSALAVPAAVGIPVTHRGLASAVDTLVILMGVGAFPRIANRLVAAGRSAHTPVAVIHRGTTEAEEIVVGTLGEIADRAAPLPSPAVIVIGEAVAFPSLLARPLLDAVVFDRR